jgi:hypothetical protein
MTVAKWAESNGLWLMNAVGTLLRRHDQLTGELKEWRAEVRKQDVQIAAATNWVLDCYPEGYDSFTKALERTNE